MVVGGCERLSLGKLSLEKGLARDVLAKTLQNLQGSGKCAICTETRRKTVIREGASRKARFSRVALVVVEERSAGAKKWRQRAAGGGGLYRRGGRRTGLQAQPLNAR